MAIPAIPAHGANWDAWAAGIDAAARAAAVASSLATVATSGAYADLSGKPAVPAVQQVAATVTSSGALVANKHNPVDANSGAKTMTLPTGQAEGTQISVEKTDASTNAVTVTGNIRGVAATTITLPWQNEDILFRANSAGSWWPVAGHKTKTSLDTAYGTVLTPEQFGAVGNGVANDLPAFTAMAAAAQTAGRAYILIRGQHYLSDAVAFDVDDIEMYLAAGSKIFTTAATSQGQALGFIGYLGSGTATSPQRNSVKVHGPGKVIGWLGGPNENAIGIVRYATVLVDGPHVDAGNKGVTAQLGCSDVTVRNISSDTCVTAVVTVEDNAQAVAAAVDNVQFGTVTAGRSVVVSAATRAVVRRIRGTSTNASSSQGGVHVTTSSTLQRAEVSDISIDNCNGSKGVVVSQALSGYVDRIRIGASAGNAVDIFNCPNGLDVGLVEAPSSPAGAVATGTTPAFRVRRMYQPQTALALGESTMDRLSVTSLAVSQPNNIMRLGYLTAAKTETITKVRLATGTVVPTGGTITLMRVGVYDVADDGGLTLIASSVNDTALASVASTVYTKALSASFAKVAGKRYAVGLVSVYSGGSLQIAGNITVGGLSAEAGQTPKLSAAATATDLPATLTDVAAGASASMPYFVLMP